MKSLPRSRLIPSTLLALAAIATLTALLTACGTKPPAPGDNAASTEPVPTGTEPPPTGCAAPAAWFPHSQTPEPNPNQAFDSFCAFHQWAWQSFLWLTQESGGTLRFEAFPTLEDVITGKGLPSGNRGPMKLKVRTQKVHGPNQPIDEVTQADSLGVLVDHGGRATYYAQYVNPLMFNEIISLHWNDPQVLNEIPPDTKFQTGDVEIKVSWKIVQPGDEGKYYVRPALVDRLVVGPNGTIKVDSKAPPIAVQVALVGFHVVGWVQGHPEAVWATFEQEDNAPDMAPQQNPSAPVSNRDWTFYTAKTAALDCNQVDTSELTLDPATQTLKPITQVCRQFPHGMVAGTKDPNDLQNLAAIESLNASVKSQIGDDLARRYFEVGAIWTNGDLQPNNDQQAHRIGSTLLNNSVVETFTQNVQSDNNCFSCHNTLMYNPSNPAIQPLQGTNINLSHVILEAYVANQKTGARKEKR